MPFTIRDAEGAPCDLNGSSLKWSCARKLSSGFGTVALGAGAGRQQPLVLEAAIGLTDIVQEGYGGQPLYDSIIEMLQLAEGA